MNHNSKESVPEKNKASGVLWKTKRRTWQNCVCNQIIEPLMYLKPRTLDELIEIIIKAQENNCKVKAVGSGHSFSDIVQTSDFLVDCHSLNSAILLDKSLLYDQQVLEKKGYDVKHLVHVENGITIKDLNKYLDKNNLALANMGGYDAQTIAGVVSTSTHGTGIGLGPIASSVASIILVGERGTVYRIEPSDGITDAVKYKARFADNELVQDDDFFNAVLVSMGCMGVIYSVILKVMDSYYLCEERSGNDGERVWEELKKGNKIAELLKSNRHLEIWVNPYAIKGSHGCLVTKRNIFVGNVTSLPLGRRSRKWIIENVVLQFRKLPALIFRYFYKSTPGLIATSMKEVIDYDGYIDKSYEVMNLGNANFVKGYSAEYAVSLNDNLFIDAVDAILDEAKKNMEIGQLYHTSPISMRFVKKCDAYLSMMNGEDKCMIEVPLLVGTKGRFQILDKIEHRLLQLGKIRPHWGQYHNLGVYTIRDLYPDLDKWLHFYRTMNKTGIFNNTFTDRCGFM